MKIRSKDDHDEIGFANLFSLDEIDEIIINFPFMIGSDKTDKYEFYIESLGEWVDSKRAFGKEKLIIVNKYNTSFLEPKTKADKERGYEL